MLLNVQEATQMKRSSKKSISNWSHQSDTNQNERSTLVLRGTITFASVTLVPTGEGGKTGAGSAVRVRRALRAVGRAPEVVRAAARGKRFEG